MGNITNERQAAKTGTIGLRHIAEKAGTSVAAASAVLSPTRSNTRVSETTRQRILQTARELKYQPNVLARALTGKPTRTIGVLFGLSRASVAIANPYIYTVLQGIVDAAAASGYNVTLFTEPWQNAAQSSGMVRDGRTDGVLVIAPSTNSDVIAVLVDFGVPVVSVAAPHEAQSPVPFVDIDNAEGAKMATNHLISLGHTRIAHLPGDLVLRSASERQGRVFIGDGGREPAGSACVSASRRIHRAVGAGTNGLPFGVAAAADGGFCRRR